MILIVTNKKDTHCNPVTDLLDCVGHSWTRLNTEDFATNVKLSFEPARLQGELSILDSGKSVSLSRVKSVWYRKPEPINVSHFSLEQPDLDYIDAEFNEVVTGLYALLSDCFWINNPLKTRIAHRKCLQLKVAADIGLKTPKTIVSNSAIDVLSFFRENSGRAAIKSLSPISVFSPAGEFVQEYGLFTRVIDMEEISASQDKIGLMPTVYQEYVEKEYEIRVTIVGDQCFPCKIDSQNTVHGKQDYRIDTLSAHHSNYRLPNEISGMLFKYMSYFDLNFGCFDIIRALNGDYVFLECNPNGQWLWIEKAIDARISHAIAELLVGSHVEQPNVRF